MRSRRTYWRKVSPFSRWARKWLRMRSTAAGARRRPPLPGQAEAHDALFVESAAQQKLIVGDFAAVHLAGVAVAPRGLMPALLNLMASACTSEATRRTSGAWARLPPQSLLPAPRSRSQQSARPRGGCGHRQRPGRPQGDRRAARHPRRPGHRADRSRPCLHRCRARPAQSCRVHADV